MIFNFIKVYIIFIYFLTVAIIYADKNKWESYIIHQNKKRDFAIYVPKKYNKNYKIPLVIVLHGGSGSGVSIEKYTGFSKLAKDEKFIVAYPDAYSGQWNDGREFIQSKSYRLKIDDVGFISKMIDKIKKIIILMKKEFMLSVFPMVDLWHCGLPVNYLKKFLALLLYVQQ